MIIPHNTPEFTSRINDPGISLPQWLDELFEQGEAKGANEESGKGAAPNLKEWTTERTAETEAIAKMVKAEILRRFEEMEKKLKLAMEELTRVKEIEQQNVLEGATAHQLQLIERENREANREISSLRESCEAHYPH